MEKLALAFIVIMSIFVVIQLGVLAGVFVSIKKLSFNLEKLRSNIENRIDPAMSDFREVLGEAKQILRSVQTTAENFASISETVKQQVERVNSVIEETTDRAREQIAKADDVVTDAIEKIEATSVVVQEHVLVPVREVSAIIRGVSSGLHFLFGRRRNAVDAVHQDEELFI